MHDDHPPNKPAGQLETAPRIRRLKLPQGVGERALLDSSAHTEIKARGDAVDRGPEDSSAHTEIKTSSAHGRSHARRQLRAYGD